NFLDLLKPMPDWLVVKLREKSKALQEVSKDAKAGEGGRNDYLTRAAGRLQRLDVLTLSSLLEINEEKCDPPLDESEVEQIFNSVSRYSPESSPEDDPIPEKPIIWASEVISDFMAYI